MTEQDEEVEMENRGVRTEEDDYRDRRGRH